jgi:NTP pyrophosphatase (non-canonical NTP hydrolase)
MDKKVTIEELKDKVKDFCEARDWDQFHNPKDLSIMISTEASELLQIFRYKDDKQMKEIMNGAKRQEVEEEVADVLFGLLIFAQKNNIDLATSLYKKIEKNEKRYPIEKAKGCNKKYNEY